MSPSILPLRAEHAVVDCGAVEAGLKGGPLTLGCDELRHLVPVTLAQWGLAYRTLEEATAQISLVDQALGTSSSM